MRKLIAAIGVALACAMAAAAHAQTVEPAARQVIARAQAASGGAAAWNSLTGLHEKGRWNGAPYEAWHDPLRFGLRIETREAAGVRVQGFNGYGDWQQHPDGRITASDARPVLAQARTRAFFAVHGFYFPSRFPANAAHLGVRKHRGRTFDVLRIEPLGGEPREVWFDRKTGLPGRIIDRTGAAPVATELSDWRRVGRLMLPFKSVGDRGGRPEEKVAETIEITPAERTLFSWGEVPKAP